MDTAKLRKNDFMNENIITYYTESSIGVIQHA